MSDMEQITVEVAYAEPEAQKIITLMVDVGTTAQEAARRSGMEAFFPSLQLAEARLGLFGQVFGSKGLAEAADYVLHPGDRVEIYRPLIADPKEVRRQRANKLKADS